MKQVLILVSSLVSFFCWSQEFSPRYELVKMSDKVNTLYHEVSPVISIDGKELYFFVSNHPENTYGKENSQDIWVSTLDESGEWTKSKRLGAPFNQNRYNQVFNVLPDGALFIRGGRSKNSKGFSIVSSSGNWNELNITDFGKMDKGIFNGGTISSDGKQIILYFSEKASDKFSDLYLSSLQPDGHWSRPAKLKINSPADDYSPFLSPDQKTLYFASDRFAKDKVGATDIYKTTRLDDTWANWSEPVNLGRSVNTPSGDAYFSIDTHGNIFTARSGARVDGGNFDLFILKPRDIKIQLTGNVYSQKTQQPLASNVEVILKDQKISVKSAAAGRFETRIPEIESYRVDVSANGYLPYTQTFKMPKIKHDTTLHVDVYLSQVAKPLVLIGDLIDKKTNQKIAHAKVDVALRNDRSVDYKLTAEEGSYRQEISSLGWYLLTGSAEGYLNGNDSIQISSFEVTPLTKDLFLSPIEVGITVRLKNIYFDFDKTTLKSESFIELDKVVDFLTTNPHVIIEIAGHTDSKGSDIYNQNLSQGRSQSVVDYLISKGIDTARLQAHGYGESKPIDTNETDEGRANNRRVEFTILKK